MARENLGEGGHEKEEPIVAHGRDRSKPVGALIEEREGAGFDGVDFESAVESASFACGSEPREESLSHRAQ